MNLSKRSYLEAYSPIVSNAIKLVLLCGLVMLVNITSRDTTSAGPDDSNFAMRDRTKIRIKKVYIVVGCRMAN